MAFRNWFLGPGEDFGWGIKWTSLRGRRRKVSRVLRKKTKSTIRVEKSSGGRPYDGKRRSEEWGKREAPLEMKTWH